jgi:YVTN family beta-propeller protein
VAVSPDGSQAYIANRGFYTVPSGTVSVIDTGAGAVTATIPVGSNPEGVAVSPDGHRAYVTNGGSGTVSVLDPG